VLARSAKTLAMLFALVLLLVGYTVLRHLVFWGPSETVRFESGGVELVGTFATPEGDGPFPAVLVLLGSGPETRKGPAYRINSTNMLRHGFAVLIYDKRGSGDSGGDFDSATFAEFAADAAAAIEFLAARPEIDAEQIGLLANSESGWFSAQVAAETGQVAFIINRVGPPLPWIDTVLWEVRNEYLAAGVAESELDTLLAVTEERWRFYADVGRDPALSEGPRREAIDAELTRLRATVPLADELLPEKTKTYEPDFYRSYAIDATYDPAVYLQQIDVPLLYVFGGRDVNIPTAESVAFLEGFRYEYAGTIDVRVYPELGHPMATWRGLLHGGYPPDYLAISGTWARSKVGR